jgi:hypothetical protein
MPDSGSNDQPLSNTKLSIPSKPVNAEQIGTQKHVNKLLRQFIPIGENRDKVVAIKVEMLKLKITDTPIAFCFLLRSAFEISAKAYCTEHNIKTKDKTGQHDQPLSVLLTSVYNHIISERKEDKALIQTLHGAITELNKPTGILSVTSLNQLVHNPTFSIAQSDICIIFNNIYPLLKAMN